MKKTFRYVSILIIAALLTVIVMKNGAIAAGDSVMVNVPESVKVGEKINITVTLGDSVRSCSGGEIKFYESASGDSQVKGLNPITLDFDINLSQKTLTKSITAPQQAGSIYMVVHFDQLNAEGNSYDSNRLKIDVVNQEQAPTPQVPSLSTSYEELEAHGNKITVTSNIPVVWSSSNSNIAVVEGVNDTQGRITSTDNFGECDIIAKAKDGGKTATVKVKVTDKAAENKVPIIFPSVNLSLIVGETVSCDADTEVTWSSSNSDVVSINSNNGLLKANSVGTATITATSKKNGKTASITATVVKVEENESNNNAGNNSENNNGGGTTSQPSNTETPSNTEKPASTQQPSNAGQTNNTEKPSNSGNSNNNGTAGNAQSNNVNVKFAITPNKNQTIKVGSTLKIKANKPVASWQSSKTSVATISNDGTVKAVAPGTTTISVVAEDNSIAQIKIAVSSDGTTVTANSADSQSGDKVPATGESSAGTLVIFGVVTLIVATFIFRKKTK